jgi:MoxR-like ATPase
MDGVTYKLEEPFMVIATQNPIETKGTFDLPEAQLDRFLIKTSMGYPTHEENVEILKRKLTANNGSSEATAVDKETVIAARRELARIYVHDDILSYAASICEETRKGEDVVLGASPRAMIALIRVAQGFAAISGREYVLPDDVKRAAIPTLAHRIVFNNNFFHRGDLGEEYMTQVLEKVLVPSEQIAFSRKI